MVIDSEMIRQMDDDAILEEDVAAVIAHCESSEEYLLAEDGTLRIGHLRRGQVTVWVEYRRGARDRVFVHNAYAHRMTIKEWGSL